MSNVTGVRFLEAGEMTERDAALGLRSCLTYGLALACDAVFEDGRTAFGEIDALTNSAGLEATLKALSRNLEVFGRLKTNPCCSLEEMDAVKMRLMVLQLQLFRMMQDARIQVNWPEG